LPASADENAGWGNVLADAPPQRLKLKPWGSTEKTKGPTLYSRAACIKQADSPKARNNTRVELAQRMLIRSLRQQDACIFQTFAAPSHGLFEENLSL
jgi:hypothetical protein